MMPFGLKNAGVTYQRLVDQVFAEQKGRNMEVYVDDSIVKSKEAKDHVADLAETFTTLRKHQMKLNPKKCVFGVRSGRFLGFMPLEKVLDKVEKSGRLTKWAFELTEFSITYQLRAAIKAQALADFLAECSYQETLEGKGSWTVFTDGSATINDSGAREVITSPEGKNFEYALKFSFKASNNEAEYEVAIAGLELCIALEGKHVCLKTDSQLVANQIRGEYEAKEPSMISYLAKTKSVIAKLRIFEIELIPRGHNAQVDALSKLASSTLTELNRSVYVEVRRSRSIDQEIGVQCVEAEPSWMDPILAYKLQGTLPEDKSIVAKIKRIGSRFIVYNGELLKQCFSAPLLKCVGPTDADYILWEIHFGICGNHIGGRALAHKALRARYYWPTMIQDAKGLVQKCEKCQKFAPVIHRPSRDLQPILNPLLFSQWGLDILGPFPEAPYQKKWLIVGIDYFSKWIEAEAASNITKQTWKSAQKAFELTSSQPKKMNQLMKGSLDFLDEVRDSARDKMVVYKQKTNKFYNRRVQERHLKVGDLVLRNAAAVQKSRIHGKLSANWEGPYEIYDEL
ncbi:uncharacterized protein LOC110732666 [Chenopodium quinoa]|uniref:uncharacterized protein LOC110732666 n=1 Tax=Chenopodium quinoa TaxID=63459 RepID=UPI000B77567C|nr:uncharacterized protein LOC110732666 [Chenopodium quinoa]